MKKEILKNKDDKLNEGKPKLTDNIQVNYNPQLIKQMLNPNLTNNIKTSNPNGQNLISVVKRLELQENKWGEVILSFKNLWESTGNAINGIAQVMGNIKTEVDEFRQFRIDQGNLQLLIDVIRNNYADQVIKIQESVNSLAEIKTSLQQRNRRNERDEENNAQGKSSEF